MVTSIGLQPHFHIGVKRCHLHVACARNQLSDQLDPNSREDVRNRLHAQRLALNNPPDVKLKLN